MNKFDLRKFLTEGKLTENYDITYLKTLDDSLSIVLNFLTKEQEDLNLLKVKTKKTGSTYHYDEPGILENLINQLSDISNTVSNEKQYKEN